MLTETFMVFQGVLNRSPRRLQLYNATRAWPDKYRFNHPDTPRNHAEYMRTLTQFDFCFTPDGHVRSTVRLFEALVTGCIPVVWSPGLQLPFTHTIDYRDIQITFNASATPQQILNTINSISKKRLKQMRRKICELRPSRFFSQTNPLLNLPMQPIESGDKVWMEFTRQVASMLKNETSH